MALSPSTRGATADRLETWVSQLLADYAQNALPPGPLAPELSLRDDLGVESLSLVSLVVRVGDELGVDAAEQELELGRLITVGDVVALARRLDGRAHTAG